MWDLTYALAEEIGDPDLFVGRQEEMTRLLKWAEGVKRRISKSTGILSRRKKGKTALLQRFFNVLYDRNDPQLIPFYYRIPEERLAKSLFAEEFYCRLFSQYFAFTTRDPVLVAKALPLGAAGRSPPIGTPLSYPAAAGIRVLASAAVKLQPPKKRTRMREPVVAYTSFRLMASKSASRVFSFAQTPA